jgi:sugar lactone lactonase YvrE
MHRRCTWLLGFSLLALAAPLSAQHAELMLSGDGFAVAIASDPQGAPMVAEGGGRIVRLLSKNVASPVVAAVDDEISSLAFDAQGSLYAAGTSAIWKISPAGQAVPLLRRMAAGLTVAPDGTLYFIQAQPPLVSKLVGEKAVPVSGSVPAPSAVAASPAALFVASADGRIWKLAFAGGPPQLFASLAGAGRPAALALDESGGLYVAREGAGQVSCLTAAGEAGATYSIPGPRVAGLAFAGVDLKDLYVTEARSGAVYRVRLAQRAARFPWEPSKPLRITEPVDGAILNRHDGEAVSGGLRIAVQGTIQGAGPVRVNGAPASVANGRFATTLTLQARETRIVAEASGGLRDEAVVLWDRDSFPRYRFSTDDNIWFLRDIARHAATYHSIFDNPYLAFWRAMHEKYGTKIHFNIYYQTQGFNLSQMPDKFRPEWQANANWIHLGMHARGNDPDRPYLHASGQQVRADYRLIEHEIERFAGKALTCSEMTVHWGEVPREAIQALRQEGVQLQVAYFTANPDGLAMASLYVPLDQWRYLSGHDYWKDRQLDVILVRHDMVINLFPLPDIVPYLERLAADPHQSEVIELMIHEQYFYPDYVAYEPDYRQRVETAIRWVTEKGYKPVFYNEGFLGTGKP